MNVFFYIKFKSTMSKQNSNRYLVQQIIRLYCSNINSI